MGQEVTQAEVLISLLVRFPQIAAVHYEPQGRLLRLIFVLETVQPEDFQLFTDRFKAHLKAFHHLKNNAEYHLSWEKQKNQKFSVLEIRRDVSSLSLEELNLITELVLDYHGPSLLQEGSAVDEEDQFEHNVLIESGLSLGLISGQEKLTGFRENGRVLVFSTSLTGVSQV
ncbi:MAG: hypothetical protein GX335_06555 [Firmicutes bacterium]|mgnify:CR=1 FL=1|nr:hypothetical protein [Bacillota bacterium]